MTSCYIFNVGDKLRVLYGTPYHLIYRYAKVVQRKWDFDRQSVDSVTLSYEGASDRYNPGFEELTSFSFKFLGHINKLEEYLYF